MGRVLLDLNNDGFDDVVIGAPLEGRGGTETGSVYVFWGPTQEIENASDADLILVGDKPLGRLGHEVDAVGDINGDGVDDLGIGAPLAGDSLSQTGAVYIVYGLSL